MTCEICRERLSGRVFDALPEGETALVDEHLAGCTSCSAELVAIREQMGLLGAWPDAAPASDLAARTISRLTQEPERASWWTRLGRSIDDALARFGAHRPTRLTGFATVAVAILLLIPVLSPNWTRGRSSGDVSGCRANLRLLGKALDRFAVDHEGRYPAKLSLLRPDYVRQFPQCPQAGVDTYTSGYSTDAAEAHFTLACHGDHHRDAGLSPDQPDLRK